MHTQFAAASWARSDFFVMIVTKDQFEPGMSTRRVIQREVVISWVRLKKMFRKRGRNKKHSVENCTVI